MIYTTREIDHRVAKKCIRPGSSLSTILPRMCTVDEQQQVHSLRTALLAGYTTESESNVDCADTTEVQKNAERYMGKRVTSIDKMHIIRTTSLVIRRGAFTAKEDVLPRNIYHKLLPAISNCVLDSETWAMVSYHESCVSYWTLWSV